MGWKGVSWSDRWLRHVRLVIGVKQVELCGVIRAENGGYRVWDLLAG